MLFEQAEDIHVASNNEHFITIQSAWKFLEYPALDTPPTASSTYHKTFSMQFAIQSVL